MSSETFSYKGISAGKYIEGEIEALNQEEASFKLKEQKVIITNLIKVKKKKAAKDKKKGGGFSFGKKAVKPEDVMIFSKQFATMVKAGLPILFRGYWFPIDKRVHPTRDTLADYCSPVVYGLKYTRVPHKALKPTWSTYRPNTYFDMYMR